jgi:hypothetical protein
LTLYPFVSRSELLKIFGNDLFAREENIPILRELAGLEIKPFECVATAAEAAAALALSISKAQAGEEPLPPLLQWAVENVPGAAGIRNAEAILSSYGPHRIPQELESFLTKALNKSPRSL